MSSEDMINTPEEEGMQIYEYIVDLSLIHI